MQEFELTFLNVNPEEIEENLRAAGASKEGEYFYRRQIFDFPGFPLDKQGAWLRLRDEGDKVTLGYKQRLGRKSQTTQESDDGMEEIEIIVDNFEKTAAILLRLGLIEKFYQENRRVRWRKNTITYDLDFWPKLEPYLEVEADTQERMKEGVRLIGLDPADGKVGSNFQIYMDKGIDIRDYQRMTFEEFVPRVS